jgi:hypothetical protein
MTGKKKERYSRTIEEKLLSFQNTGYFAQCKASGFTTDRRRVAANEDDETRCCNTRGTR